MNIAVVGAGISGIFSAYLLDSRHSVTLFESRERLGGHAHTTTISTGEKKIPVDTGFIVYNERNYPLFTKFLTELNVPTRPSTMSFSFRSSENEREYGGDSLSAYFSQRSNLFSLRHIRMFFEIVKFYYSAPGQAESAPLELTLGEYLDSKTYSSTFIEEHLLPMVASIWSVPVETARQFPFRYVIDFFQNHGLLQFFDRPQWRTIEGGSRTYLEHFKSKFGGKILVDNPVEYIQEGNDHVRLKCNEYSQEFDCVVLAVHSDQAFEILDPALRQTYSELSEIPYQSNNLVLHTDTELLPRNEEIWSAWNYHRSKNQSQVTLTYDLSILQDLSVDEEICLTLNAREEINPKLIIDTFEYDHPIYSSSTIEARNSIKKRNGLRDIYFTGAWLGDGFHEDGAKSAANVAESLGVEW